MEILNALDGCMAAYLREALPDEAGGEPRAAEHPCHGRFVEKMKRITRAWAGEASPGEAHAAVVYILEAALRERGPGVIRQTLLAAQEAVPALLPLLDPEDCAALLAGYRECYPEEDWLPAQHLVAGALEEAGRDDVSE